MDRVGYYHAESALAIAYTAGLCTGISLITFVLFDIANIEAAMNFLRRHREATIIIPLIQD